LNANKENMDVACTRAAHYAHFLELIPELIGRLAWTKEQIHAHRTEAFRALLLHAKQRAPWHAERLSHIDPATATLSDLSQIPVMSKPDLMQNWDEIVTVPGATLSGAQEALSTMTDQFYCQGDNVIIASGGTGGRPGIFLYDWTAIATNIGSMSRSMISIVIQRHGGIENIKIATIGAEVSAHGSYVMSRIFSNPDQPLHRLSAWRSIDELVLELNIIQPQLLNCYPSCIAGLAIAAKNGDLNINPDLIFFNSEKLSDGDREIAISAWPNTGIFSCWASSEAAGTFPCPLGDGFHVSEDLVIIEPVDANGAPVAPGQRSDGIYITNLFNKALPIIRYYIDDIFELSEETCKCGSEYRKVKQVHGRSFERFQYGDISVHPLKLELAIIEQPVIYEYQIRQTMLGATVFFRSKGIVDKERLALKVKDALVSYGIANPEVIVEEVDQLERTAVGKLKRFVPLEPSCPRLE
jgi:phenylacetate-CoA ligase